MRRLRVDMEASITSMRFAPVRRLMWRIVPLTLRLRTVPCYPPGGFPSPTGRSQQGPQSRIYKEILVWLLPSGPSAPLELSSMQIGEGHKLHLAGEPLLESQMYAQPSFRA